ncbi:MAG: prepilin-type N-terminal cleavage/methylation domain-containing protein [Candidatus Beckwithbacteria bacterium]
MKKTALGFTLIELLVAVGIGLILVAGGLAAYKGMGEKQKVKQAGVTFETNLRLFRQKAMSGEKPAGCEFLQNYTVTYTDSSSYTVQAMCSTGTPGSTTFTLGEGVLFTGAGFGDIIFLTLKTWIDSVKTITLKAGSYSYEVNIEKGGVISGKML